MDLFTSGKRLEISKSFNTATTFSASIDSRGRITVPSGVREILELDEGDILEIEIRRTDVTVFEVESVSEAFRKLEKLEDVKSFNFSGETLEVVTDAR